MSMVKQLSTSCQPLQVRGLYKGVLPPMLMHGVLTAVLFGVEGPTARLVRPRIRDGMWKEAKIGFCGGLAGGFVQSFICAPIELVMLRTQHLEVGMTVCSYKGNWATLKDIYRRGGVRGCYQGVWVTAFRDTPGFAIYFASYKAQMHFIAKRKGINKEDLSKIIGYPFICGGITGMITTTVTYPIDFVKTRVLISGIYGTPKLYQSSGKCFLKAWREGGVQLLYRGLTLSLLRAFVNSSFLFSAVEISRKLLSSA